MGIVTMMSSLGGSVSAIIFWVMDSYNALDDPFKDYDQIQYQVIFFNTSPKISHNLQGIHRHIVNQREFCMCSIILYWRHAKFAIGRAG